MVIRILALFALVAAAATLGVVGGRATVSNDDGAQWDAGYRAGVTAQRNAGTATVKRATARYEPGQPGYEDIYNAGRREGQRLGERLGRTAGANAGRRTGYKAGLATALPDFAGGWRPSHWYMVKLEPGASGKGVQIGKRVIITRGSLYGACQANADDICAVPQN